jgi:hypothetical protein
MNFDSATLREELDLVLDHEGRLRRGFKPEYAMNLLKKLRQKEFEENGYVMPRNSTTGY